MEANICFKSISHTGLQNVQTLHFNSQSLSETYSTTRNDTFYKYHLAKVQQIFSKPGKPNSKRHNLQVTLLITKSKLSISRVVVILSQTDIQWLCCALPLDRNIKVKCNTRSYIVPPQHTTGKGGEDPLNMFIFLHIFIKLFNTSCHFLLIQC